MTAIRIIEAWCPPAVEAQLIDHLTAMEELDLIGEVVVQRADGRAVVIGPGRGRHAPPLVGIRSDVVSALAGVKPTDVRVVTVVAVPAAASFPSWLGTEPTPAGRLLAQAGMASGATISESVLVAPSARVGSAAFRDALTTVDATGRIWAHRFVLSPEDASAPGEVAQPVGDDDLVALAATTASVLVGAIGPGVSPDELPLAQHDDLRAVRSYVRRFDRAEARRRLIADVLDAGPVGGLVVSGDPDDLIERCVEVLVERHRLRHRAEAPDRAPSRLRLVPTLGLLLGTLRSAQLDLPPGLVGRGEVGRSISSARALVPLVADGGPLRVLVGSDRPVRADLPDRVRHLAAGPTPWPDCLPCGDDPEPAPGLWPDLAGIVHGLLDGSGPPTPSGEPAGLDDPGACVPLPLRPEVVAALSSQPSLEEVAGRWPLSTATADPARLERLLARSAPGHSDSGGAGSATAAGLGADRRDADRSVVYRIGETVLGSLDEASRSLGRALEMVSGAEWSWDDGPERRFRRRAVSALGAAATAVGVAAVGWWRDWPLVVLAVVLALACVATLVGVVTAARRYRCDVLDRDGRHRQLLHAVAAVGAGWTALRRFVALYDRFVDWATLLQADVHHPTGLPHGPVVLGDPTLRPRALVSLAEIEPDPHDLEQLRSAVFGPGWRVRLHRETVAILLERHRATTPIPPTPVTAVAAARLEQGAPPDRSERWWLAAAFLDGVTAQLVKREVLERAVAELLSQDGEQWLDRSTVLGDPPGTSPEAFLCCGGEAPFSTYLLDGRALSRSRLSPGDPDTAVALTLSGATASPGGRDDDQGTLMSWRVDLTHPLLPVVEPAPRPSGAAAAEVGATGSDHPTTGNGAEAGPLL